MRKILGWIILAITALLLISIIVYVDGWEALLPLGVAIFVIGMLISGVCLIVIEKPKK